MGTFHLLFLDHPISFGKTAAVFSQKWDAAVLNLGEMVRKEFRQESELGTAIQSYLGQAEIIPDVLLQRLVLVELDRHKGQKVLLYGYPKTQEQFVAMKDQLVENGWEIESIWYVSHNKIDHFLEQYLQKPDMKASMEKYDGVEAFLERGRAQYAERKKAIFDLQQSTAPIPWQVLEINDESEIEQKLTPFLKI
ncbi:nucleoside monophosphate kinase [Flavobacterium sp.]|uniref:nucleoside monophosphate kinase n=1 Tax=Flavobacterium sp. TaxID=239 RepID=UPI0039E4520E